MLSHLHKLASPRLHDGTMVLALSGWMDGGMVSTGTVRGILRHRSATEIARIDPDPFYIYNFPGSMEIAALFRPIVKYDEGLVKQFELPTNIFHCDEQAGLAYFIGREPNMRWQEFADCIFEVASEVGVKRMIFIGSFGGTVPHTREPRMFASVSHAHLKKELPSFRFSDYQGPAGFSTMLMAQCAQHDLEMMSLVAEIPGYLQGENPLSIEAVTRRLSLILKLPIEVDALRRASDDWEVQVSKAVEKDAELAETVKKLEEQYDNELIGKAEE
jgi:predicted ATP-grasp superfamily ATP-dependent carboligase